MGTLREGGVGGGGYLEGGKSGRRWVRYISVQCLDSPPHFTLLFS